MAQTILDVASDSGAQLIVLGARGPNDLPRLPGTSLAAHLMRASKLPVLVVPPDPDSDLAVASGDRQNSGISS